MTKLISQTNITKLISQGRQGPPGPGGPGVGVKMGQFFIRTVANTLSDPIVLISSALYPFEATSLKALKTRTGTVTMTIKLNGVAITGWENIAVTSTPQDIPATALNDVAEGDRMTLELSAASAAASLEFTMEGNV